MSVLENLKPAAVWKYFEEICSIPHISFHEKELSDYCVTFARDRGLYCEQDELGNVLIVAEATEGYEDVAPIILQGHLDMVGDKVPECPINMETEPIQIVVDGDYVRAEGTTLGGDDGIAVAYALAILDSKDVPHPRLEVVLTISEEVGLIGANTIDLSSCKARKLLNVDSDREGYITVGCAGGVRVTSVLPVEKTTGKGIACNVLVDGLRGGHSGMEIDKGRANANVLLGRVLEMLREAVEYDLVNAQGGVKENVIPKEAFAKILVAASDKDKLAAVAEEFQKMMASEYGTADPDICLSICAGEEEEAEVLTKDSRDKVVTALNVLPNGVQAMSVDLPGLVETSLNLGVMSFEADKFVIHLSVRSSVTSAKAQIVKKIELLTKALGGTTELQGDYPGWEYVRESEFRDKCVEIFKAQYGYEPRVETIHAGLECGLFTAKVPGLDCISIGPDMLDIHTPMERVDIASVERVWEYIKAVIAAK